MPAERQLVVRLVPKKHASEPGLGVDEQVRALGAELARRRRVEHALRHREAELREIADAMEPYSSGRVYVNLLGVEGEELVRAAYGANYDRLVALKNTYDPTNLFRLNQNIKPTA